LAPKSSSSLTARQQRAVGTIARRQRPGKGCCDRLGVWPDHTARGSRWGAGRGARAATHHRVSPVPRTRPLRWPPRRPEEVRAREYRLRAPRKSGRTKQRACCDGGISSAHRHV
jgi:hypothetical protein